MRRSFSCACPSLRWFYLAAMALTLNTNGAPPKINLIEPFLSAQVLIHFDTEANRTYELQYTEKLTTNVVAGGNWTNLFTAPSTPFPNHYVVVDTRLRPQRFYRLRVFP